MALFSARGLNNFISEIRGCSSIEDEQRRVDKELAKLRNKFTQASGLNSYDKKKYSWKLIYIYMLGYDIDFGHMQIINLISSTKYSEKAIGYVGTSILLTSSDEMMTLAINSIRNDLSSPNAAVQCLALTCIANMGGMQLCESLCSDVLQLVLSSTSINHVRKKACLCLRRILQVYPNSVQPDELVPRMKNLLADTNMGVVTSAAGLLLTACSKYPTEYAALLNQCVDRLHTLVIKQPPCSPDYNYYAITCPWLQVKLLRVLQRCPVPSSPETLRKIMDMLKQIILRPEASKIAKNNALYGILFEAVNVVIAYGTNCDKNIRQRAFDLLGKFIATKEANIRYIGLHTMSRLIHVEGASTDIKKHQETVLRSLKDADNSVRRRALDLLFDMCDRDNALPIVKEMINYLAVADLSIREEMVLKIAILAEKFATDLRWYVDTVLQLITIAGSDVSDDIWHRVVQIVTNNDNLQQYTARVMFDALEPKMVDETTLKFGAYILGEFGYCLVEDENFSSRRQFEILYQHYSTCTIQTKRLLLTTFIKMDNLYPELQQNLLEVFETCRNHGDIELQQRACEYFRLHQAGADTMQVVLESMPVFPSNRESALVMRLRNDDKSQEEAEDEDEDEDNLLIMSSPEKKQVVVSTSSESSARAPSPVEKVTTPLGLDPVQVPLLREWFNKLLCQEKGILFENEYIQIGIKQEYRGAQGKLNIFYGNKTENDWRDVAIVVQEIPSLRMQIDPLPDSSAPRQQLKQQIMVECLKPFADAPKLSVSFSTKGRQHNYPLRLPIVASSFTERVPLEAEAFMQRWQALDGPEREEQIVFSPKAAIDMTRNRKILSEQLKFAIATGLDKSDTTLSLATTFRTGSVSESGNKISIGCLLRLEANHEAKAYRLTVRAVHGEVSLAMKNIVVNLLT